MADKDKKIINVNSPGIDSNMGGDVMPQNEPDAKPTVSPAQATLTAKAKSIPTAVVQKPTAEELPQLKQDGTAAKTGANGEPDFSGTYAAYDRLAQIYKDAMDNSDYKPKTKAELEAERKRERRDRMIGAVGDGISAIANLVATTQYAPNMYNSENSLEGKARERYEKMREEYKKNRDEYLNNAINYAKYTGEGDQLRYQQWAAAQKRELEKQKSDNDAAIAQANLAYIQAKGRTEGFRGDKAETDAAYEPELLEGKKAVNASTVQKNAAATNASNARAAASSSQVALNEGKMQKLVYGTINGKPYYNQRDYEEAADTYAKENGVESTQMTGKSGSKKETRRPIGKVVSEANANKNANEEMNSYKRGGSSTTKKTTTKKSGTKVPLS
jgi:hypothetical protein